MLRRDKKPNRLADYRPPAPPCPECGVQAAHFVPPMFGEDGFYVCSEQRQPEERA